MEANPELIRLLGEDSDWLTENYDSIRDNGDKVIAVKNKKVLLEAEDIETLMKGLEEIDENPAFLLIEVIPPKDAAFIL